MDDDTDILFDLPSVARKKVSAAFDGGRITSDAGVTLLALADRRIGIVDRIAGLIADPRDPALITHSVASILRARVLAIACGYEDANDLDDRVPPRGVRAAVSSPSPASLAGGSSSGHGRQHDVLIIAELGDDFQGHVSTALDGPFDGMDHPHSEQIAF
jgi:hypothetical protein